MTLTNTRMQVLTVLAASIVGILIVYLPDSTFIDPMNEVPILQVPEIVYLRPQVKDSLVRDVAAGRRSLFNVAALFSALDQIPPAPTQEHALNVGDAGLSADELACRRIIDAVQRLLFDDPEGSAIVACLEDDFQRGRNQVGGLVLPDRESLNLLDDLLAHARSRMPVPRNEASVDPESGAHPKP